MITSTENKITIIVPVFNGERFLERLVGLLAEQTSQEFESIFVNDGSTDGTRDMLDAFQQRYNWIRVIHQNNNGVSAARNNGIRNASGTHITFLDADDYLEKNAVELIQEKIRQFNPDLIAFGINYVDINGGKNECGLSLETDTLLDREVISDQVIPCMINLSEDKKYFLYDYSCNKVFKKELILRNNISFIETRRVWEDRPFVVEYLKHTNSLLVLKECLYNYVYVSNSLSQKYDHQFFDIILENYHLYKTWFEEAYDFDTPYSYRYWSNSIGNMISRTLSQTDNMDYTLSTIGRLIHNETVRSWFLKRELKSQRDKRVNQIILKGDIKEIVAFYQKEYRKKEAKQRLDQVKSRIRRLLKKIMIR